MCRNDTHKTPRVPRTDRARFDSILVNKQQTDRQRPRPTLSTRGRHRQLPRKLLHMGSGGGGWSGMRATPQPTMNNCKTISQAMHNRQSVLKKNALGRHNSSCYYVLLFRLPEELPGMIDGLRVSKNRHRHSSQYPQINPHATPTTWMTVR